MSKHTRFYYNLGQAIDQQIFSHRQALQCPWRELFTESADGVKRHRLTFCNHYIEGSGLNRMSWSANEYVYRLRFCCFTKSLIGGCNYSSRHQMPITKYTRNPLFNQHRRRACTESGWSSWAVQEYKLTSISRVLKIQIYKNGAKYSYCSTKKC